MTMKRSGEMQPSIGMETSTSPVLEQAGHSEEELEQFEHEHGQEIAELLSKLEEMPNASSLVVGKLREPDLDEELACLDASIHILERLVLLFPARGATDRTKFQKLLEQKQRQKVFFERKKVSKKK